MARARSDASRRGQRQRSRPPRHAPRLTRRRRGRARPPAAPTELTRAPLFSEELGIALASRREADYFRWFLASLLYGGRISATIARNTYRAFERHGLVTPQAILDAGWDYLVDPIMREGGYVRYDGQKSTQILRDCAALAHDYRGRVGELDARARSPAELEERLLAFYGVGPVTANIFLRELRPFWRHADPAPLPRVVEAAARRGLALGRMPRRTLAFCRLEAALLRESRGARPPARRSGRRSSRRGPA